MNAAGWLLLSLLLPALLSFALIARPARPLVAALLPFTSWPALAAAWAALGREASTLPEFSLGGVFRIGFTDCLLITGSALVWTLVGSRLRGQSDRPRWLAFALVAQTGSLGTLISYDVVSFYLFFSVMTLASYGLVNLTNSAQENRAAGLYLALALAGEFLILTGFMLSAVPGPFDAAVGWLLFLGFGAKLGVPPFHVALPIAYGAAPPLSAALLGSVLLNSALAGLLRFLPLAGSALPELSAGFIGMGVFMAFGGATVGIMQSEAKALLGYSTISQMGIACVALGIAAGLPDQWDRLAPAIVLFALHHGLVKAALFLGVERQPSSRERLVGFVLLSLALAAAPLTAGAVAKLWFEEAAYSLPPPAQHLLHVLLPLTSAVTALLMARFIFLIAVPQAPGAALGTGGNFGIAVALALLAPWAAAFIHPDPLQLALEPVHLWVTAWPLGLALSVLAVATLIGRRRPRMPRIPPGDVLALFSLPRCPTFHTVVIRPEIRSYGKSLLAELGNAENWLRSFRAFGLMYLGLITLLALLALLELLNR